MFGTENIEALSEMKLAKQWSKEFPVNEKTFFALIMQLRQAIIEQHRQARDVSLLRIGPGEPTESYSTMKKYCFLSEHENKNLVLQGFNQVSALFEQCGLTQNQKFRVVKAFYTLWDDDEKTCCKNS